MGTFVLEREGDILLDDRSEGNYLGKIKVELFLIVGKTFVKMFIGLFRCVWVTVGPYLSDCEIVMIVEAFSKLCQSDGS